MSFSWLTPSCPAPWMVWEALLVRISTPVKVLPKIRLLPLFDIVTLPAPASVTSPEILRSVPEPVELSWSVPALVIVPWR